MTVFVVGGSPGALAPATLAPAPADRVIAADGGAAHAAAWGWPVSRLVGDLDSLSPEALAAIDPATPIARAPAAKDETDLELALAHALALDADPIVLCGVLGARVDHALAAVLLLARPDLAGRAVLIADGRETLRLLRGPARLHLAGAPGDRISLLPLGGDAEGVHAAGVAYPLRDETLFLGRARGVSNELTAAEAEIVLRRGQLLLIHAHAARATGRPPSSTA